MNEINKTLFIPLYGKALISRMGIILRDKKAEELWAAEGFDLGGKVKANGRCLPMGRYDRPAWDLEQLIGLGFKTVFADTDISDHIPFSEKELMEYGDETPQLMIIGTR